MKPLTQAEINERLKDLPSWEFAEGALHTTLQFENFKEAFSAMTRISFEVEAQQHHPEWTNTFNQLRISLTTHDADGITDKDIKLADSIEEILSPGD